VARRGPAKRHGIAAPQAGAVTFIQRFGSLLNLNCHAHALLPDGVVATDAAGAGSFHPLPPPWDDVVVRLLAQIGNRERQAVGLTRGDSPTGGHYPGDPDGCTENTYRQERNALGERFLPRTPRTQYSRLLGEAPATMSDADLQARWNTHNSGPDVPR
jgi:hypothetical protein